MHAEQDFLPGRGDQSPSTSDAAGASNAAPLGPADIAAVPGMQSGSVRRILGEMVVDLRMPLVAAASPIDGDWPKGTSA